MELMKVMVVVGTRPEIIKMCPVIKALARESIPFIFVHSGQHYSKGLDGIFFQQFNLPEPHYRLNVGSGSHAEQTSRILLGMERVLSRESCDIVLVQGDTNTVLGASLAASKLNIPIGHVEAGLRSGDMTMPEEQNRKVADCLSTLLFAPTPRSVRILTNEGADPKKVFLTGNTIVDALLHCDAKISPRREFLKSTIGTDEPYLLLTLHRPTNVDYKNRLQSILEGMRRIKKQLDMPILWPIHPRSLKNFERFGLDNNEVRLIEPIGYLEFIGLLKYSELVLTDSGGVQEEACVLKVPCVTLRENTERPETLEVGSNMLAGTEPDRISNAVMTMINRPRNWTNPFGDGNAGRRIVDILLNWNGGD